MGRVLSLRILYRCYNELEKGIRNVRNHPPCPCRRRLCCILAAPPLPGNCLDRKGRPGLYSRIEEKLITSIPPYPQRVGLYFVASYTTIIMN
nr:MAG TPA: hypothetical protein [Caudoviricetes sp.]